MTSATTSAARISLARRVLFATARRDYLTSITVAEGGWWLLVASYEWVEIEADANRTQSAEPETESNDDS